MLIGVLGATGYTGRLVAAELARRGVPARVGGRDPARLAALPGEQVRLDIGDQTGLRAFLTGLDVVLSCAGPFTRLGAPVVDAAVAVGVPYLDSTGEPAFIAEVLARHAGAQSPVVPACGVDYLPGDLAVAVAAAALPGRLEQVRLGYAVRAMSATRGTLRSAAAALGSARPRPRLVQLAYPAGDRTGVVLPWGEEVLVPHRLPGVQAETAFVLPGPAASVLAPLLAATAPVAPALLRGLAPLLARRAERAAEGPSTEVRARSAVSLLAVAAGEGARARVLLELRDVYALTATLLVEAALRLPGCAPGAQTTAQAFPGAEFLDAVAGPSLSWQLFGPDRAAVRA